MPLTQRSLDARAMVSGGMYELLSVYYTLYQSGSYRERSGGEAGWRVSRQPPVSKAATGMEW